MLCGDVARKQLLVPPITIRRTAKWPPRLVIENTVDPSVIESFRMPNSPAHRMDRCLCPFGQECGAVHCRFEAVDRCCVGSLVPVITSAPDIKKALVFLAFILVTAAAAADSSTLDAAIGGGLGGAAGAAIGNEIGGRDVAILGGVLGGAVGT